MIRLQLIESLQWLKALNEHRLARFPTSPFVTFAALEIAAIEARAASSQPIDRAFHDDLGIGLMCARELEASETEYCAAVYAMLDDVRLAAEHSS